MACKHMQDITSSYTPFGSGLDREPGLHLTSIIRSLQVKLGIAKTAPGWEMNVCADIGFLWEGALGYAYRDKRILPYDHPDWVGDILRPEPMCVDGIWMSPDGVGPDPMEDSAYANHEYKCTWRSILKLIGDDFYWMTQFQAYARALKTNVTIVHAMYLMGNYRGSGPQHKVMRIVWDMDAVEKTWGMVLREKEVMENEAE
jgi:hypothetical protein